MGHVEGTIGGASCAGCAARIRCVRVEWAGRSVCGVSCVRVYLREALLHDVHDARELVVEDAVGTWFQDAGFFRGDLLDGVPEEFGVVEADVHDRADLRRGDDVRCIEASTHADLEDDELAVLLLEPAEGHRGDHLEVRRLLAEGLCGSTYSTGETTKIRIRNHLSIDGETLVKLVEVRRDIETGTEARRRQNRLGHDAGRALPVCAGDVHIAELLLWIAERVHEIPHPLESDLRMFPVRPVKERDGFIPVHFFFFPDNSICLVRSCRRPEGWQRKPYGESV